MQGWVSLDADGREFLVRTGTGTVTAMVRTPLGLHLEIDCTARAQRPRAIRYLVAGLWPPGGDADQAILDGAPCSWTIEWHRRDDVPASVPVLSLDLHTDATARVTALARLEVEAAAEVLP